MIVIGAGPAGSIAALVMARAGVRVHLIDRATFPRDKLCGDTVNPGSLAILERIGADVGMDLRGHVIDAALPISGMTVTGRAAAVTADYPGNVRGAALMRRVFDAQLLDAAIRAGARFTPGVSARGPLVGDSRQKGQARADRRVKGIRVATPSGEEEWRASIVIAADGRHSSTAFALGLTRFATSPRRWAFGAYFENVAGLQPYGEMHIRRDGYIGVAPLPGRVVNLCVVHEMCSAGFRLNAEKTIAAAIEGDPALRERFARARRVSPITALGPLAVDARDAGCPGLLLAGDAAGFIDPMTGDGLRFALRGGELAAEAALRELASGVPAFARLRAARAREFAGKWRVNRSLRVLVGSPRAVAVASSLVAHWPAPVRMLVGIAGDVRLVQRTPPRIVKVRAAS